MTVLTASGRDPEQTRLNAMLQHWLRLPGTPLMCHHLGSNRFTREDLVRLDAGQMDKLELSTWIVRLLTNRQIKAHIVKQLVEDRAYREKQCAPNKQFPADTISTTKAVKADLTQIYAEVKERAELGRKGILLP
jgi:hypothetical protein